MTKYILLLNKPYVNGVSSKTYLRNPISQDQNLNNSIKLFVHPNETFMCSSAIPETDSIEVCHADHIDITAIPQTENIDVPETDNTNNDMHYESEILDVTELLPELFPPITEDDVELLKSTKSNTIRMPTLKKIAKLIIGSCIELMYPDKIRLQRYTSYGR